MDYELSRSASRVIWFLILLLLTFLLVHVTRKCSYGLLAHSWPTGTAVVMDSHLEESAFKDNKPSQYTVRARYRYVVDGVCYTNDVIRFTMTSTKRDAAMNMLQYLPPGRTLGCRYNPANPQISTLLPGIEKGYYINLVVIALFTFLSLLGFLYGWRWRSRTTRRSRKPFRMR